MDRSINKVELRGNVGQSPKIIQVGDNRVIRFSLATNERFKDRNGTLKEETTWHNIVAWEGRGMPDFAGITKGACVSVSGRIKINKYTGSNGEEKQSIEILASRLAIEDVSL